MDLNRIISYIMIITGGIVVFYAQDNTSQNIYVLIIGIVLLMFGLYRVASGITTKNVEDQSFIESEEEEQE